MDKFNFKTEAYEGPFDLLYDLIEKNKIDIYDIPIASLTDQYLNYINNIEKHDMESMSDFIVMAAELIRIKSKMLLPKDESEDKEEEDPRDDLVRRLIEYKKFKIAAESLAEADKNANVKFFRKVDTNTMSQIKIPVDTNLNEVLDGVTMELLYKALEEVLSRKESRIDKVRSGFKSVKRTEFTIAERIDHIRNLMIIQDKIRFDDIFNDSSSKMEIAVTFSAMLELIKLKEIKVRQDGVFSEIYIFSNAESGGVV